MKTKLSTATILKTLLKFENVTQRKLSVLTMIPEYKISKYCRGEQEVDVSDAAALSRAFDITFEQLYGQDNYFNWFIIYYSQVLEIFPIRDQSSLQILDKLIKTKEVYVFNTRSFEEIINIDLFKKIIQLKTKSLKIDEYGKEWTIIYDQKDS